MRILIQPELLSACHFIIQTGQTGRTHEPLPLGQCPGRGCLQVPPVGLAQGDWLLFTLSPTVPVECLTAVVTQAWVTSR